MNPAIHPALACLWAVLTIASAALAWILRREWRSPFAWFVWAFVAQQTWQWAGLALWGMGWVPWDTIYTGWWEFEFLSYALVACIVGQYAWLTLRNKGKVPGEFVVTAGSLALSISAVAIILSRWQIDPDARPEIRWSQGCAFVLLWLLVCVYLAANYYVQPACNRLPRDIIRGLIATFGVAWLTSCMRSYMPFTREQCWCLDLSVQLAAVSYWTYSIRKEKP